MDMNQKKMQTEAGENEDKDGFFSDVRYHKKQFYTGTFISIFVSSSLILIIG